MRPCLPARATVRPPSWCAPPGACDCHLHILGPHDRYPLSPARSYTPPEALAPAYLAVRDTLGLQRMVVVQPSVYGTDNACTLDAVERLGGTTLCRAVIVVDADTVDAAALAAMHARGARGARFNAVSGGGGAPLHQLEALARRVAPLGWHLQVFLHGAHLPELAPRFAALPVPVVVDHMGHVRADRGVDHPEFAALLRLLETGRAWVKLCGYRSSVTGPPYADVAPFAGALLAAAPERCVWGTDWPHTSLTEDVPDDGALFDLLGDWAPTDALRRRVLVDNPALLYGFDLP